MANTIFNTLSIWSADPRALAALCQAYASDSEDLDVALLGSASDDWDTVPDGTSSRLRGDTLTYWFTSRWGPVEELPGLLSRRCPDMVVHYFWTDPGNYQAEGSWWVNGVAVSETPVDFTNDAEALDEEADIDDYWEDFIPAAARFSLPMAELFAR